MKFEDYINMDLDNLNKDVRQMDRDRRKRQGMSESSLNRVRKAWSGHDTGTISGFRGARDCGEGEVYTKAENEKRNTIIKQHLLAIGYGVVRIKGSWYENGDTEVSEASLFVVDTYDKGHLKKDLMKFGKMFDQDAITYAPAGGAYVAISTNKCTDSWPGFGRIGVETTLGSPKFGKTGIDGFSKVNNRAFVFEGFYVHTMKNCGFWGNKAIQHTLREYDTKQSILRLKV